MDNLIRYELIKKYYSGNHEWYDIPFPEGFTRENCLVFVNDNGIDFNTPSHVRFGTGDHTNHFYLSKIGASNPASVIEFIFIKIN